MRRKEKLERESHCCAVPDAANAVWWDLGISINMTVTFHLIQREQAIMHISRIGTSRLFSAPVRAEVDLIAGDRCALLTTAYSNAKQSFTVTPTTVARRNYESPFPNGLWWLMPFNMKFTKWSLSTSPPVLRFVAGTRPIHPFPRALPSPSLPISFTFFSSFSHVAFKKKYDGKISAFIPYVIYQWFLKARFVGFDCCCIKNIWAYCCQPPPLFFIRFDRWGFLKPACLIQLMA